MRNIHHHHNGHLTEDLLGFTALLAIFIAALFLARLVAAAVIAAGNVVAS